MGPRSAALPTMVCLASAMSLGCDWPEFDSPSEVDNLRILGLSSSAQLVQPGQTITLDALWVDTRPDAEDEVITAWFPGCANPEFGDLGSCQEELNDLSPAPGEEWPAEFAPIAGSTVDVEVAPDLLEGREEWGLQYFFFAVCRGSRFEFSPSRHPTVPITCRDDRGRHVSQPDFRLGFRTVTALPIDVEIPQANPLVVGFDVDGQVFEPHCLGEACRGYHAPDCDAVTCPRLEAVDCGDTAEAEQCEEEGTAFRVLLDQESIGIDWLLGDETGLMSVEVWARYFTTSGEVEYEEDLLHNREPVGETARWDDQSQSRLAGAGGERFLWAVVYDSVGGVGWGGIGVEVY